MKNRTGLSLIPKMASDAVRIFDFLDDQIWKNFDVFASPLTKSSYWTSWNETETSFSTEVEIPRFTKDDIKLKIENGMLHINAEKDDKYRFYHTMNLPEGADTDKPAAKLDHGILTITFPKVPSAKARTIEIK